MQHVTATPTRLFPNDLKEGELRPVLTANQPLKLFTKAFGQRYSVPFGEFLPLSAGSRFAIGGTLKMKGRNKLLFRDTSISIRSGVDGEMTFEADVAMNFDSNTLYVDTVNNRVGIGTAAPSVLLHVQDGAGTEPTYLTGTVAVFQNNDNSNDDTRISIIGGNSSFGFSILDFGDADDVDVGALIYDHGNNSLTIRVDAATAIVIDSSQNVGIGLTPTANMPGLSIETGLLTLKERVTPTADTNYGKFYTKTDNKAYFQDGAGTEHEIAFV